MKKTILLYPLFTYAAIISTLVEPNQIMLDFVVDQLQMENTRYLARSRDTTLLKLASTHAVPLEI